MLTSGRNLLAGGGDANDDALAPALVAGLEGGAHDGDVAGAVERVVAAAVRHLDELLDDGLALELERVDEVGSAELARPFLLGRVDVDDDDAAGLVHDGALDDREAYAARAEHGNGGSLLDASRDAGRAVAGRDTASQEAGPVHGRILLHGDDADVGHHRVLREG